MSFKKKIVQTLVNISNVCFSYNRMLKLKHHKNVFYTEWISKTFGTLGQQPYINKPIYVQGAGNIYIGNNFWCDKNTRIDTFNSCREQKFTPKIIIGNNVSINQDCHIAAINRIEIGDNTLIASKVYISDHYHGTINKNELSLKPNDRPLYSKGPVIIGKGVWIGEGVAIMPGITIGDNAIVGANAVVTKSINSNTVVAGNPARVIKILE